MDNKVVATTNTLALTIAGALAGYGANAIQTDFWKGVIALVLGAIVFFVYEKFIPFTK